MKRSMVVFVFFLSSIVLAHPEHEFASVTYRGSSEVTHEGDYVDFTINLSASCYVEQQDARNRVIDSLSIFKKWLDEIPEVNYIINLINISESNRNYNSSCDGGYSASQEIKVTLNKRADDKALDKNTLEKFFNDLQTVIGPMNFFEHRQRQARAQQKATREFLAFLGSDYKGQWHLHAAEFNDFNANYVYIDLPFIAGSQVGNIPLPPPGPTNDNLSTIELRAIKLHIEANFVFYFLPTNHISL